VKHKDVFVIELNFELNLNRKPNMSSY